MNNEMFYKGILSELEKRAYIPYPQKPKQPFYKRPGFWAGAAGLGAAGAGMYGLVKGMKENAPQTGTSQPLTSANASPIHGNALNNFSDAANGGQMTIDGANGVRETPAILSAIRNANTVKSIVNKIKTIPAVQNLSEVKIPGSQTAGQAFDKFVSPTLERSGTVVKALAPTANLLGGAGMLTQALNPYNGLSAPERYSNAVPGVTSIADGLSSTLTGDVAKSVLPELAEAIPGSALSAAARYNPWTMGVWAAGSIGKGMIEHASDAGEQHSRLLNELTSGESGFYPNLKSMHQIS